MLSLKQIRLESQRAARNAARNHREPYIYEAEDQDTFPPFPFPDIGSYRPKGWKLIDEFFVDSSGFGNEGERAMTVEKFLKVLKPGRGYAIIEKGEFQLFVGEFEQIKIEGAKNE